jgi:methyl-galactoside transport system permease protein
LSTNSNSPNKGRFATRRDEFNALSKKDKQRYIGNWFLDRAMIIIIILLVIYIQVRRPAFLKPASIINILTLTAARLPIALGVAGCIVLAGTDLSAGRVVGLTAFTSAIFLQKTDIMGKFLEGVGPQPVFLILLMAMGIGAVIGLINGFCVAKFKVHPFIVTLSTQLIVYGVYLTTSNAKQISSLDPSYTTSFVTAPLFKVGTNSVNTYVLLAIIVTIIMWVIWNKTRFGKNMFAVGSNEEAARVSGVNVTATIIGVFTLAGVCYGYTGFIEAARLGASTGSLGLNYELDAIAACVIGGVSFVGGIGKISGVLLGVFLMQLIINGMTFIGISGNTTYIIKGAVILIACIIDMRKYLTKK